MIWESIKKQVLRRDRYGFAGLVLAASVLTGCGESASLDLSEKFTVAMLGVFEAPADSSGNAEPRSMNFTLQSVTLSSADAEDVELYEDEAKEFSIINRSQIIAEGSLADHVGKSFTGVTVTFSAAVTAAGRTSDDLAVTLPSPALVHTAAIDVTKAKSQRLNIRVQWKNIITYDDTGESAVETLSAPTFGFELKNE